MWIQERNTQESLDILGQLVDICGERGGPLSKHLKKLWDAGLFIDIANFKLDYTTLEVEDVIYARQIQAFLQKNAMDLGIGDSDTRRQAAVQSFYRSEEICKASNNRLCTMSPKSDVNAVFHRAIRKISRILGDLPELENLSFSFGPGANTNVKGDTANAREKLSVPAACSYHLSASLGTFLAEVPMWVQSIASYEDEERYVAQVEIHEARFQCVPKNFKTDRAILVEPLMNSFFQKGFGSYIRDRLGNFGVNLRDQSYNQHLARLGSIDGSFSTIDLSMASDTLATGLVQTLLPPDWFETLYTLATRQVKMPDGEVLWMHKFSSMGNGFTFELESLIFYALASAAVEQIDGPLQVVNVYGDDIIVPRDSVDLLEQSLEYAGFSVNREKSFSSGPFRESCGADYFNGMDVRPLYVKTALSDRNLYAMHNWFLRHGETELANACLQYTRKDERLFGPDGFGDGHLIGSYELRESRSTRRAGYAGGYFDTYSLKPRRSGGMRRGDAVLPVYSVYVRSGELDPTDPFIVRGTCGYVKQSIYTLATSIFR